MKNKQNFKKECLGYIEEVIYDMDSELDAYLGDFDEGRQWVLMADIVRIGELCLWMRKLEKMKFYIEDCIEKFVEES